MKRVKRPYFTWKRYLFCCVLSLGLFFSFKPFSVFSNTPSTTDSTAPTNTALIVEVNSAIGPASQDYIETALKKANQDKYALVIIRLDTPGGLDTSMRGMIRAILASEVPVVTYVAPSGARAASAGTFIMYASHIAAMAPGTNIGAASPVGMGGIPEPSNTDTKDKKQNATSTLEKKAKQDAEAYIRSLAHLRGRNAAWGVKAVEDAVSISAEEALDLNVIDLIANSTEELLKKINGRSIKLTDKTVTLNTQTITLESFKPNWRNQFLSIITDPNIAYILMLIGIYGIFFELSAPGFILPGVMGAISLILALYAFQLLPINYAGFGLILLGIVFMILEGFSPTFGALGIGGVIAFVVGSIFLLEPNVPGFNIAWSVIGLMTLLTTAFFLTILTLAIRSQRRQVVTGTSVLIGSQGIVIASGDPAMIQIQGELWKASANQALKVGQKVRVTQITGLTLIVEPIGD